MKNNVKSKNKKEKNKKSNVKVSKSKTSNKKKNNVFLIGIIGVVIMVLLLFLLFFLNFNKTIDCTKTVGDENTLIQEKKVAISFKGKKIKEVNLIKSLNFNEDYLAYIDIVKESLEKEYKALNLHSSISKNDNNLTVNIKYHERKVYLLDNIEVSLDDGSVNINIISDNYNNGEYESIDLSKKSNPKQIIKYFKQNGYICK